MMIDLILAIIAIILGVVILIWPKMLNMVVAIWLLVWGILQMFGYFNLVSLI